MGKEKQKEGQTEKSTEIKRKTLLENITEI